MQETKDTGAVCAPIKSRIGGQALIEGVMMRGLDRSAMAVRKPSGEIDVESWPVKRGRFLRTVGKIPVVRGLFNFGASLIEGYKCLSKSAEKAAEGEEEETPSKFEEWLQRTLGERVYQAIAGIGMVLGVALAVMLFVLLPTLAVKGLDRLISLGGLKSLAEGLIKMGIFIGYLALVSRMKEMRRLFQYHGAEHKTIFCYEKGLPLTAENVRIQKRFHPRCGTNFLILMLIISILIYSVVTWESVFVRVVLKILMFPLIMGVGYELLKLCGRYENWLTKMISWPGLQLQRLTTKEPDDAQIEVAIASLMPVIPEDRSKDNW